MYDVLIIGSGPAGLSAAIYAKRANLSVLVVGKDGGALEKAEKIDNYFGLEENLSGPELLEIGVKQATALGAEVIKAEVLGVEWTGNYAIDTTAGRFEGKALIFAMGNSRKKPNVKGIEEFEGRGVSYCAVCDAFFFRGKAVAVLGSGNYAFHEAEYLKNVAGRVTLLTNGENNGEISSFEVIDTKITHLEGADRIESVVFEDGNKLSIDGLFVAQGFAGASELANKLGVMCENGNIIADQNGYTNLPGCFAAGDCIGGILQVSTAVGEGAKAALSAIKYIRSK